ncbi:MAG: gamma-glutamylcyclotransferase family protein [Candidatus Hadarchaeales archaeon]
MTNVFVYGTLMRKFRDPRSGEVITHPRSNVLACYQPVLGRIRGFRLVWPSELNFPFIKEDPSGSVKGELYQCVPDEIIRKLDEIEGVSFGLFTKKVVEVELEDGRKVDAIVYVGGEELKKMSGWTRESLLP